MRSYVNLCSSCVCVYVVFARKEKMIPNPSPYFHEIATPALEYNTQGETRHR